MLQQELADEYVGIKRRIDRDRGQVSGNVLDERHRIADMAEYYGYHWGNSGLRSFALLVASGYSLKEVDKA